MANKNTLRRKSAAHDAFGRVKQQRGSESDHTMAQTIGRRDPLDKKPKVGASAGAIMHHLYGSRGRQS